MEKSINEKLDFIISNLGEVQEVFTTREAAAFLKVSEDFIRRQCNKGILRHKLKGNTNEKLFRRQWLIDWMEDVNEYED